jgi:hypothetical protein
MDNQVITEANAKTIVPSPKPSIANKDLISLFALIVSLSSFLYTWLSYEKVIQPHLYCGVGDTKSSTSLFGLYLRNNGRGTAIVNNISIFLDSNKITDLKNLRRTFNEFRSPNSPIDAPTLQPIGEKMEIAPGEEIIIYADNKNFLKISQLNTFFSHLSIKITYSSLGRKKDYKLLYP